MKIIFNNISVKIDIEYLITKMQLNYFILKENIEILSSKNAAIHFHNLFLTTKRGVRLQH